MITQRTARMVASALRDTAKNLSTKRGYDNLPDERKQILDHAMLEITELTKIVSELVELATDPHIEQRAREEIRLDEIVDAVVTRARRRSELTIHVVTASSLIVGDPELVERAIANLIDNACKWSPKDGSIEVTVRDGGVSVLDRGPGISPDDLPHVFERFYRSQEARAKPGSGLGLAIVKKVADGHGGSVRAENSPGGGALLTILFPSATGADL